MWLNIFCRTCPCHQTGAQIAVTFTVLILTIYMWIFFIAVENDRKKSFSTFNLNTVLPKILRKERATEKSGNGVDYVYYDVNDDNDAEEEGNGGMDDVDLMDYENPHSDEDYKVDDIDFYENQGKNFTKVVIGVVCCRNGTSTNYLEQTSLLLKSVLISAELYNVTRVDFHVFLEIRQDEDYLLKRLEEIGYPSGFEQVDMNLIVHSAVNIIPPKYRRHMVHQKKYKCSYTRFFFPSVLSRVDSILYLGIDMVVTGNILRFWDYLKEMKREQQMIAATKNFAMPENTVKLADMTDENLDRAAASLDFPQLSPKGINSALMLMNLTRLRAYGWEEKYLRAFQDYSKISTRSSQITAQKVMNVLLFYNPALYLPLPCHFNFGSVHCSGNMHRGNSCLGKAKNDPYGIQLVHVNGPYHFEGGRSTNAFTPLIRYFHLYNMTKKEKSRDTLMKELIIPVKTSYDRKSKVSKCFGKLDKVLFNDFK